MRSLLTSPDSEGEFSFDFGEVTSTDYIGQASHFVDYAQPQVYFSDLDSGSVIDWSTLVQWQNAYPYGTTFDLNETIPRYVPDYTTSDDIGLVSGGSSWSSDASVQDFPPSCPTHKPVEPGTGALQVLNGTHTLPIPCSIWQSADSPALSVETRPQALCLAAAPKSRAPPSLFPLPQAHHLAPAGLALPRSHAQYPHPQSPRSPSDLYTPTYTRGTGSDRSAWCPPCQTWHTLRDSAWWYHQHFVHGISCATRQRLPSPAEYRELKGNGDWEGKCGGCDNWVAIASGEKGRTAWFRHAYKCQLKGLATGLRRDRRGSGSASSRGKSRSPKKTVAKLDV